jgi:hypothetical protein
MMPFNDGFYAGLLQCKGELVSRVDSQAVRKPQAEKKRQLDRMFADFVSEKLQKPNEA